MNYNEYHINTLISNEKKDKIKDMKTLNNVHTQVMFTEYFHSELLNTAGYNVSFYGTSLVDVF